MRILVYEYITGGGLWSEGVEPPSGSLLAEGSAMLHSVANDFAALADVEVVILHDRRLPKLDVADCRRAEVGSASQEREALSAVSAVADYTLLIAPEWNDALASRAHQVWAAGGRLLSPSPEFIELAADKHATAERLYAQGVSSPRGVLLESGRELPRDFPYPAVLKPRDGAGSQGVRLIESADEPVTPRGPLHNWRLEPFCPGQPVSIAALCGPAGNHLLPACSQRLSSDGRFSYLGGSTPLAPNLNERAQRIAAAALAALPATVGYVGLDLILGSDAAGLLDMVIEVNPRVTTSYVGLRALSRANLASAMLAAALGQGVELSFAAGPIEFRANGDIV